MERGLLSGVVLLTGGTGFLGTHLAHRLIGETDHGIVALVRAGDQEEAARRLSRAWWDFPELAGAIGDRVEVLRADVCEERLGLDEDAYRSLVGRLTHIIHTAADMRLDGPIDELRRANVQGTANVLELARAVHADHGLTRLSHVSTAYVAGSRKGPVPEDTLTDEYGFSSPYELSKYEGELLVKGAKAELPISVFRPGMVVGHSRTGAIKTFNTLYFPLRLYLTGKLRILPMRSSLKVNLVPVDYVADAVTKLTFMPEAEGLNFHLTAPWEQLPTAKELLGFTRRWTMDHIGIKLKRPLFIPAPVPATRGRYKTQKVIQKQRKTFLEGLIILAPYFNERRQFQRDNVDRLLGPYDLRWRELLPRLLEYATYLGFLHRSDRTVHEQVFFRLKGRSMPVTYHDVVDGRANPRSTKEVRRDILAAAEALRSMGVGPGDRVALVGFNSTRYLTLDIAIGLVGAVGVPLYYTSPPAEIEPIISASGAKLLFVGTPKLLGRLGELKTEIPVVSFCRTPPEGDAGREVMAWETFLAQGKGSEGPTTAPVGFGDLATIRFTSGTTGPPKGVTFDHGALRWMAESLASLFHWETRNTMITYLSFLPMNHVVEGILAAYSPYYAPARLDIYFLEDFRDLQRTLPAARPTMFFAVPRFYEKVWEGVLENNLGKKYIASKEGLKRRFQRRLLRWGLLKKVGLNRCAQLFVGAAPMGEEILRSFQGLGIEVHDAYGLTEAPLVTMNRLGTNRIGTVGEPLPQTEVRIAEDGEVLLKGPQVTPGYYGTSLPQPFHDGWFLTGDLGHMTEEGSLVVRGRKKELIVTSYGKNILPVKVESMLRELPGVDEVMLVGDERPYCTALIWVGSDDGDKTLMTSIEGTIAQVNATLSNAEQIKRWVIMVNDLTIEGGDLTASLKLKRREVTERMADVVASLYGGPAPEGDGILRIGGGEKG
jgi:long-chain acyl-CoA synthetase